MIGNPSEQAWWRLPNPRPLKPNKTLLTAAIVALSVWLALLLLIAIQASG
jgi:hypothetical protein